MQMTINFYLIYINSDIHNLITFNESNIYKRQKIYENAFNFLEINIKDQSNRNIEMKDFFKFLFILVNYIR